MKFLLANLFFFSLWSSGEAVAHPVSYKHALGVMSWNQPFLSDYWLTYSFRPDMAVAARAMRMDMPEGKFELYMPQLDLLVKRWNEKNYQANIYAFAGYGAAKLGEQRGETGLGGIEVDAESTKYFVMAKAEWIRPTIGPDFNHYEARIGIAPYEAEFNEMASWLMLQYQYHPALVKKQAITPIARFFYKNVLWEAGASFDGDYMINFMFHF